MCCGIWVSRNSDPVGSPRSFTSSSSWRASAQPLVDVEALVEIGIVDQPLPADDGPRLLEVGPHHDDQVLSDSRSAIGLSRCAYSSAAAGVVNRTGTDDDHEPWIASLDDHCGDRGTRASETTFEARSLIGISSSRIAGGISGRTFRMRRSSVG